MRDANETSAARDLGGHLDGGSGAEAARAQRDLQTFVNAASHELQEPLRAVTSFLRLLDQRYGETLAPPARDYVAHAVEGARRMDALLAALTDYSRVTTRGKPFARVATAQAITRAWACVAPRAEMAHASMTSAHIEDVVADGAQLTQVFHALFDNALKFEGPEPPRIHVEQAPMATENAWHFEVSDNGIGLDMQYAERIFEVFQRLHTRDEYPGTGMGLAICTRIAERHGGRMWVTSEVGAGARMHFTIRRADASSIEVARPPVA